MELLPEWHPQTALLLAWPTASTDWNQEELLDHVQSLYVKLIRGVLTTQPVILLIQPKYYASTQQILNAALGSSIYPLITLSAEYNDTWLRDTGPLSCRSSHQMTQADIWLDFQFNGWGEKHAWKLDNRIPKQIYDYFYTNRSRYIPKLFSDSLQIQSVNWIVEGGSIDSNGHGLLLTTSRCLLNPNRGPQRTKADVEAMLINTLGMTSVLWLDDGHIIGDDTDGHIDTLARFCSPSHILYQACDELAYAEYNSLQAMAETLKTHAADHQLTLTPLPWPDPCYATDKDPQSEQYRLPATYANFLILNHQVWVPQYHVPQDSDAITLFKNCFPAHDIIGIDCRPLIQQGGSLHCITMQLG